MKIVALSALALALSIPAHAHSFLTCHDRAGEWTVVDNGRGLSIAHLDQAASGAKICDERAATEEEVHDGGCAHGAARATVIHSRKFEAALDLGPDRAKVALHCKEITRSDFDCTGLGGSLEEAY